MLSERQFSHLQEMDISLWRQRKVKEQVQGLTINQQELVNDATFTDILIALSLSHSEINIADNSIDLGLFNWVFHQQQEITFEQSTLSTPSMDELKQSASLKRQLWQCLWLHNLCQ